MPNSKIVLTHLITLDLVSIYSSIFNLTEIIQVIISHFYINP